MGAMIRCGWTCALGHPDHSHHYQQQRHHQQQQRDRRIDSHALFRSHRGAKTLAAYVNCRSCAAQTGCQTETLPLQQSILREVQPGSDPRKARRNPRSGWRMEGGAAWQWGHDASAQMVDASSAKGAPTMMGGGRGSGQLPWDRLQQRKSRMRQMPRKRRSLACGCVRGTDRMLMVRKEWRRRRKRLRVLLRKCVAHGGWRTLSEAPCAMEGPEEEVVVDGCPWWPHRAKLTKMLDHPVPGLRRQVHR